MWKKVCNLQVTHPIRSRSRCSEAGTGSSSSSSSSSTSPFSSLSVSPSTSSEAMKSSSEPARVAHYRTGSGSEYIHVDCSSNRALVINLSFECQLISQSERRRMAAVTTQYPALTQLHVF